MGPHDAGSSRNKPYTERPLSLDNIDRLIHEPARLLLMAYLAVVDSADFTFLMNQTGLTWGNLSSHLGKLEDAGYVEIEKSFVGKKPQSMAAMTDAGREAFRTYRERMRDLFTELPE